MQYKELGGLQMKRFQITFKGQVYELDVEEISLSSSDSVASKTVSNPTPIPVTAPIPAKVTVPTGAKTILAPIPGKILGLNVKSGDYVKRGDVVCILEAMKMQNEIVANQDGTIGEIKVAVGQAVATGDVLVVIS